MFARTRHLLATHAPVRVVAYGDSISEVGRTPSWHGGATLAERNWAQVFGQRLRAACPASAVTVANFGIGGQNSYEGLGRLDWLAPLQPDLVLIAFGANDCGYHYLLPAETETALTTLAQGIRARFAADVVLLTTGGDNPLQPGWQHLDETLAAQHAAAATANVTLVDLRAAVLAATGQGARWTDYHNGIADCHPNDRGHQLWADAVWAVIGSALLAPMPVAAPPAG